MKRLLCSAFAIFAMSSPALAVEQILPPSISVNGTGKASAKPDMANVSVGVTTSGSTAKAALAANNTAMNNLINTIKQQGVADKDVQTSGFNVYPQYYNEPNRPPRVNGYQVSNQVSVRVRNVAKLGDLLDAVVQSGANNINGVSFSIDNPEPLLDRARTDAVADARRKAELYAAKAGVKVGRVMYITESGGIPHPPMPMMSMRAMAADASSVPVQVGENEVQATVSVVYAIE